MKLFSLSVSMYKETYTFTLDFSTSALFYILLSPVVLWSLKVSMGVRGFNETSVTLQIISIV